MISDDDKGLHESWTAEARRVLDGGLKPDAIDLRRLLTVADALRGELEQARTEVAKWERGCISLDRACDTEKARAEAAEAECERLRGVIVGAREMLFNGNSGMAMHQMAAALSTPPEPAKPAPAAGAVGVGLPNLVAYVDTQIMGHRKEEDRYCYLDQRTSKFHEGCRRAFEDMRGKIEALANEAAADGEG
jgi:hypothetical protein